MLKIEKLNEEMLESVTGGFDKSVAATFMTRANDYAILPISFLATIGCDVAGCVNLYKASKAKNNNNISDYNNYIRKAKNCTIAAASLLGVNLMAYISDYVLKKYLNDNVSNMGCN